MRHMFALLRAVLREIFDENAYARYLVRTQMKAGRESYRAFEAERTNAAARKPRCCWGGGGGNPFNSNCVSLSGG